MDDLTFVDGLLSKARSTTSYPTTPELRARVLTSIAAPQPATRTAPRFALTVVVAVTAMVVGVALALPTSRGAVADLFGIEGSEVEVLPAAPAGTTPTPFPTPHDIDASAAPASLPEIEIAVGRPASVPDAYAPTSSYLVRYDGSAAAILRFDAFDLWQVDAAGDFEGIVGKDVTSEARITDVSVDGVPARWISGGAHLVAFYDGEGRFVEESQRTVERNTLIWRTEAALYRIETDLGLAEAIEIAETLP